MNIFVNEINDKLLVDIFSSQIIIPINLFANESDDTILVNLFDNNIFLMSIFDYDTDQTEHIR